MSIEAIFRRAYRLYLWANYGERYRNGEIYISTFAESTINEVVASWFCVPSASARW